MPHLWPYLLLLLPSLPLEAATIYRSVDDQGTVLFTDTPREDSERIDPGPISVVPSIEAWVDDAPAGEMSDDAVEPAVFEPYERFAIVSPEDGRVLPVGYAGDVKVALAIEPALREAHRVQLLLDGEVAATALNDSAFELYGLNRGERRLQAVLLDAAGRVRQRSEIVTLYVKRASIYSPANPNNPAGRPSGQTNH